MRSSKLFCGVLFALVVVQLMTGGKVQTQLAQPDVKHAVTTPAPDLLSLVAADTGFAFDLYHQLRQQQNGNLIFSPYSISLAFAMLYAGARGETAAQMAEVFHYALPPEQLASGFHALDLILQPRDQQQSSSTPNGLSTIPAHDLTFMVANGLWGQVGLPFEETYLQTLDLNYDAELHRAEFSAAPEAAQQAIDQWVEQATGGRIKTLFPPGTISPQTRLVLANAVYFKGAWTSPFNEEKTYTGSFHLLDGNSVSVPMMVDDVAEMACVRGKNYDAIRLTYGASANVAMLILLPDAGEFENFTTKLNASLFQEVLTKLQGTNTLTFNLPRFKFDAEVDLQTTLRAMGMNTPFDAAADFTGISTSEGLFIDNALHKATISVDEQGTEATGVTASVIMPLLGMGNDCGNRITVDHPFFFAIYHRQTGTILFLGQVTNPAT